MKEYLNQLRTIDRRINAKQQQMEYYWSMACRATSTISAVNYGGTGGRSKVDDYGSRAIDINAEIEKEIDKLACLRKEAMAVIEQIEDSRYREVLEYRYCNNWRWDKIATYMHYDRSHVINLHGRALLVFAKRVDESRLKSVI